MNQTGSLDSSNVIASSTATIIGNISTGAIEGRVTVSNNIAGEVIVEGIIRKEVTLPYYEGEYNIVPNVEEQVLYTSQRSMASNLTIDAIPFYETSNPKGGYTVVIGG